MRTTARISLLTLPVLLTLPAGCDRATQPEFTVRPPEPQNSVAYLKSLCDGKSSVAIAQDITIRGFVTANDLYGEFHRTIVVEDASGGISIAAEGSPLADLYPFGIVATAATCVYAKEPLPQGTGSLYGIIDYFAGKYTLRVTNREAEFSGTAAHSAATRPTAGRPARTTRTTRAGVTAATPPTAYP